jgi:death-on-curing protein
VVLYLTPNDVLGINEQFVGSGQLRDYGLLDAAVTRPQASAFGQDAYPTIHEKAAALLHGLARNHPFVTGNKRTAWTATAMFYTHNGYDVVAEAGDVISLTNDVGEGLLDVVQIATTLRNWARPFPVRDNWMDAY